jgi:DNA-directed RNA polymerase specialized sigma24 family protein
MNLDCYRDLRSQARRLTRTPDEAEDLVQDTLVAALHAGRSDAAWLAGTLRRQAAMQIRTAVRRRRREQEVIDDVAAAIEPEFAAARSQPEALLQRLPPAARRLATLALHGMNADEVRWILGITDTAFRQRLTSIRKSLTLLPEAARMDITAMAPQRAVSATGLQFGLLRRALKAALNGRDGLGTHDGDGHLLILRGRDRTSL